MIKPSEATFSSICWNVALSAVCWSVLYLLLVRIKWFQQSPEFYCRIVSTLHALIAVAFATVCHWQGPDPYIYPGEANTALHDTTLVISLGYFIYDLCWSLYYRTEPAIMIIHHIASIFSIGLVLLERTSGAEAVAGILSLELTNPLLQLRWFLRTAGLNLTLLHTAVELFFIVTFLIMRLGFGSALTYSVVTSVKVKGDVKLCTLTLYLISLAFIYYILQFLKRKYTTKKQLS